MWNSPTKKKKKKCCNAGDHLHVVSKSIKRKKSLKRLLQGRILVVSSIAGVSSKRLISRLMNHFLFLLLSFLFLPDFLARLICVVVLAVTLCSIFLEGEWLILTQTARFSQMKKKLKKKKETWIPRHMKCGSNHSWRRRWQKFPISFVLSTLTNDLACCVCVCL